MEWAGAFGDLGTLLPFFIAYVSLVRMDMHGVLVALGLSCVAAGLYYRVPVPVQPMKAIGTVAITQAAAITPGAVLVAGLATGLAWLGLGITGAARWIAALTVRPVLRGMLIGLGLQFVGQGIGMALPDPWIALAGALLVLALFSSRRVPAMLALLAYGIAVGVVRAGGIAPLAGVVTPGFHLPSVALGTIHWEDLAPGLFALAIPQIPLTLGNALIATAAEHNRLFAPRRVTETQLAVSTGILNLAGPLVGGIPVCHGAGGMAGHVRFGARTGGATVILGGVLLAIGLLFGSSAMALIQLLPPSVLGVILTFAGIELAMGARGLGKDRGDVFVLMLTAGLTAWHVGAAFLAGLALWHVIRRGWVRLE
jgi:MFS superfamily sulfate permease-like transporter